MDTITILKLAADMMDRPNGWITLTPYSKSGARCALGALISVIQPDWYGNFTGRRLTPEEYDGYDKVVSLLCLYLNLPSTIPPSIWNPVAGVTDATRIAYWNDSQTSAAPVIAAFRGLAAKLEHERYQERYSYKREQDELKRLIATCVIESQAPVKELEPIHDFALA